ncbi:ArnT family glycosyltransferase [Bifidobacterium psychraerophilum]|uniref:ArnT family glycosyltransferase n=1 Tax=Bifidobacterium psychraerophilum TaxID=218140 RepID=UPI0039E90FC0
MKLPLSTGLTFVKAHILLTLHICFALLLGLLMIYQPAPMNLFYSLSLSPNASVGDEVTFTFDQNPGYKGSSTQQAAVTFNPDAEASIRVDPLNLDSDSLQIRVHSGSTTIRKFETQVRLNDRTLYTVTTIGENELSSQAASGYTTYTLSTTQLKQIQNEARLRSEMKFILLAALVLLYLVLLLRLTCLRSMPRKYFLASTVIALVIVGFCANVLFIKQPLTRQSQVSASAAFEIDQNEAFTIQQKITPTDDINKVTLPVSLDPDINRFDTGNSQYHDVYNDSETFTDQYIITIAQINDGTTLFKGLASPSMLNDDLTQLTIPITVPYTGAPLSITIEKTATSSQTALHFQGYPDTNRSDFSTGAQTTGLARTGNIVLNVIPGYQGFEYQHAILYIILIFGSLLIINLLSLRPRWKKARVPLILVNYSALLVYCFAQFKVFIKYVGGFPDELAHISYIAYLKHSPALIPDFSQMRVYGVNGDSGTITMSQSEGFNYLGHPPLYYQIMKIIGGFSENNGVVHFDLNSLRLKSLCIGLLGIALIFYIGFTRLPKIPLLQLLFGLLIISPPNMIYVMSGISNDTLALLTVSIFVFGIVRFYERRYNFLTYVLIALGIGGSLLTKLTAGVIVGVSAVLVVAYTVWKERSVKPFIRPSFLTTLPLYLIPVAYFFSIWRRFHTIQPGSSSLAYEEYIRSTAYTPILERDQMGIWDFVTSYVKNFMNTWFNLAGGTAVPRNMDSPLYSIDRLGVVLILLLPFVLFVVRSRSRSKGFILCGLVGVLSAFVVQVRSVYSSVLNAGRFGGYSSRYYLCAISIFALATMWIICRTFIVKTTREKRLALDGSLDETRGQSSRNASKEKLILSEVGVFLVSCFIVLLVFDGFIYSVLYNADSILYFVQ